MIGDRQPKYAAVAGGPGEQILSYTLNFASGTSLEQAKLEVLREFPPGAKFGVTDADEARCVLMDIKSRAVEAAMDGYRPMVGFSVSRTPIQPSPPPTFAKRSLRWPRAMRPVIWGSVSASRDFTRSRR